MLQRIQSIYLLLAAVAAFALFALAFVNVSGGIAEIIAFQDGDFDINDNIILTIMTIVCGAMALINIFLFNNRKLQMNISKLVMLLNLTLAGLAAFFLYQTMNGVSVEIVPNGGFAMPVLAILFTFLANRNINKDEKLVKSAYNRLR
jgi:peptidoglycan/LPS O-acetylase OafA/YrhL